MVWHTHMHNSLTHRSHSHFSPQEEFLLKILKLRDLFAFHTSRTFTLLHITTQQHYFTENRKKEKKTADTLKIALLLVPTSLQRSFEQFSYLLPLKVSDWKNVINWMLIKYKLTATAETYKPFRKESFFFVIKYLGTGAH